MNSYHQLKQVLADSFDDLTPQLQSAAEYFITHPEEIGLNSMRSVARAAGVNPATVTRLSKALGFASYEEFREPFRQRLRTSNPGFSSKLENLQNQPGDHLGGLYEQMRDQEISNVNESLSAENYELMNAAVATLQESEQIYVLGLRGAFAPAFLFHYAYQLFRRNSKLLDTGAGILADQLRSISKNDAMLVISFPPYTQMTIDVIEYAANANAQIIAITDSDISPAARVATHTIITAHKSQSFYQSFTGSLAVTQALITLLVANSDNDALEIVKEAESQLSKISAYW